MKDSLRSLLKLAFLSLLIFTNIACKSSTQPNVIYILADDLGIGDVSAYNPDSKIKTQHIDQLAAEGVRFTDAHSGSAVCTPTRYGILTGRYSWRGSLKKGVTWSYDKPIIEEGRLTVAQMLQDNGYETACIGKWHLGMNWADSTGKWPVDFDKPLVNSPNSNGFDYFFGIPASLDIPPYVYVENGHVTGQPNRLTENKSDYGWWRLGPTGEDFEHTEVLPTFFEKAKNFIAQKREKPFFLYLPLSAPHTPILPDSESRGGSKLNEYGDFVLMVDTLVGDLLAELKAQGLDENTLIIFTSDNGCAPYADTEGMEAQGHFSSLNYRGYKADIYEGGHRIPLIMKWADHFEEGGVISETNCLTDFIATMADLLKIKLPDNAAEDSFSLMPLLTKEGEFKRESTIHHSVNGNFAYRKGDWKLIMAPGSGGWSFPKPGQEPEGTPEFQLYNLKDDIAETKNLVKQDTLRFQELKSELGIEIRNGRSNPGIAQPYVKVDNWPGLAWLEQE